MTSWLLFAGLNLAQLALSLVYLTLGRDRERWQVMAASLLLLTALIVAEWSAFTSDSEYRQTIAELHQRDETVATQLITLHRRDEAMAAQMIALGVLTRIRERLALECRE